MIQGEKIVGNILEVGKCYERVDTAVVSASTAVDDVGPERTFAQRLIFDSQ